MIVLDYFLYDNRTWSAQWGHDWGIKAATGMLAARQDLRGDFSRYCGAMPADDGRLADFGQAMGGIRSRTEKGYLLCVTLESRDPFGRPSWAVFGLWCPDTATLQNVLAGDPVAAAKAALGSPTPPASIHVSQKGATLHPARKNSGRTTFRRFAPGTTVREVSSILLGAIRAQTPLPNVLGITATCRLPALAEAGFDRVYCHPQDDLTERALVRHLSSPDVLEDESEPGVSMGRTASMPPVQVRSASFGFAWPMAFAAVVLLASAVLVLISTHSDQSLITTTATGTSAPSSASGLTSSLDPETKIQSEKALQQIAQRLKEFNNLDPEVLRLSRGFQIAEKTAVLPENEHRRQRVRQAYSTLLEVRQRMVDHRRKSYIAYYFDETGANSEPTTRLQKVADLLKEAPLGAEACTTITEAFGFELEREDSIVSRWCASVAQLESNAKLPVWSMPASGGTIRR